jgi:hypothetical protein
MSQQAGKNIGMIRSGATLKTKQNGLVMDRLSRFEGFDSKFWTVALTMIVCIEAIGTLARAWKA